MDERGCAPGLRRRRGKARSGNVDPVEVALEHADQVDDRVGPSDRPLDRPGIAHVGLDESDLPDLAQRLQEIGLARIALRNAEPHTRPGKRVAGIAADESAAAEHGDDLAVALESHGRTWTL